MKGGLAYVVLMVAGIVGFLVIDGDAADAPRFSALTSRLDQHGEPEPELTAQAVAAYAGPGEVIAPALSGVKPIASDFDRARELHPITGETTSDEGPVGAFRFICQPGQLNWDDPIVYPGRPGGSPHLHQWFGNTAANALSTYASLRRAGDSTCMGPLNRSAYWMPAMIAGGDTVVRPDYLVVYYKRYPATAKECREIARACLPLPHGLRYIFGYDMLRMGTEQPDNTRRMRWKCVSPDNRTLTEPSTRFAGMECPAEHLLIVNLAAPDCWDGRNLDSADHRAHMAYPAYDGTSNQARCPATHPYLVPQFTLGATWRIQPGDRIDTWHLASDRMPGMPAMPAGASFHSDWFGAWDPDALRAWTENCIDRRLSCVDGNLGDGTGLRRPAAFTMFAEPRRVPLPPRPAQPAHAPGHMQHQAAR